MLFESLKMQEEESIATYFLRVDEVVNSLKDSRENLDNKIVGPKILRLPPLRFDAKVSPIEEMAELDKLIIDKLYGIPTTYEMRTNAKASSKREMTFKVSKKGKDKSPASSDNSEEESDGEETHFVRKSKKSYGKFKGKLSLTCFNCGKKEHFASKYPYEKEEDNNYEN